MGDKNTLSSLLQSRSAYGGQKHLELSTGEEIRHKEMQVFSLQLKLVLFFLSFLLFLFF